MRDQTSAWLHVTHAALTVNGGASATQGMQYPHTDLLGSTVAVSVNNGNVAERSAYDVWGKRLVVQGGYQPFGTPSIVSRGYTEHEMLDEVGLIHMNGRVYDPTLARFLSADPFVQFSSQPLSYNRYSYVMNNPVNATDPSGYFLKKLGRGFQKRYQSSSGLRHFITGVSLIVTIASGGATAPVTLGINVANAAIAVTLHSYGSGVGFRRSAGRGLIAGATAFVGAGAAAGIGDLGLNYAGGVVAHGVSQGALSEIQGGSFRHGFYAGAIGSGTPNLVHQSKSLDLIVAAAAGGLAAEVSGGKFATGAVSASLTRIFNHHAHRNLATGRNNSDAETLAFMTGEQLRGADVLDVIEFNQSNIEISAMVHNVDANLISAHPVTA